MKTGLRLLGLLILGVVPAFAVLGQYESSVSLDQQNLRGEDREQAAAGYRLHQITTPNGAVIREYVSPEGKVFGIAWQAQALPNLQQLLGSYFDDVHQAAVSKSRRGGPLIVKKDDFMFFSGGHMRYFVGRAYVPSLLPKNVSAEVVR